MKSQTNKPEEKNKINTPKFGYSNTKSMSKTLGELEFRYISISDLKFFNGLEGKVTNDMEFISKALYHQLITPKTPFAEFSKIIDEELIGLGRDFVKHEKDAFKDFKETTDAEFFTNFRRAIITYYQKYVERLQSVVRPMIESSKKVFKTFKKQHADIIKQHAYFAESIRGISEIAKQFRKSKLNIVELITPAIEQYQLDARFLSEVLTPQIDFWQKWTEQSNI